MSIITPSSTRPSSSQASSGRSPRSPWSALSARFAGRGYLAVRRTAAALVGAACLFGALQGMPAHRALAAPAAASPVAPATSAYGVHILDSDGGERQAKAPLSTWTSGPTVSNDLASTGDFFKLNTTCASDLHARAASDGASASIGSGTYQLRDRPAVTFSNLQATCTRDGGTEVSFDKLAVDGVSIINAGAMDKGYTYDLPDSIWGTTQLHVAERTTGADGSTSVTALRIEAEAGSSEIWRVQLGVVNCAPAPEPTTDPAVSGFTVTSPAGKTLISHKPRLDGVGKAAMNEFASADGVVSAKNVAIEHRRDGGSHASVGSFEQVPDTTSGVGEYMWSALRVYGLALDVDAKGRSTVTFGDGMGDGTAGVFANGVWINTGTDLYTGMGPDGTPRVHVYFNERIAHGDGSVTINALRYEDLTGAYPSVVLGQVLWTPSSTPVPQPTPEPTPAPEQGVMPMRYAYGLSASGPSDVAAAALSRPQGQCEPGAPKQNGADAAQADASHGDVAKNDVPACVGTELQASAATADDGNAGQIAAKGLSSQVRADGSKASVDTLVLYPGTALETRLSGVAVSVDAKGHATMTTAGGTVAGTKVAAGEVKPNTRFAPKGRITTIVLNSQQSAQDGLQQVSGVLVDDGAGLGAKVQAAVITADAPAVTPVKPPVPSDGSGNGGSGSGGSDNGGSGAHGGSGSTGGAGGNASGDAGKSSGAIAQGESAATAAERSGQVGQAGRFSQQDRRRLALHRRLVLTGSAVAWMAGSAMAACVAGSALVVPRRRRRN